MMGSEEEMGGMIKNSGRKRSFGCRCQDCGNQAKKECEHSRCRNCCRGRGFECQSHVKSTWVPVSQRRPSHFPLHPHHQITPPTTTAHQQLLLYGPNPNRRHIHTLGFEEEEEEDDFPSEASFPAEFRCVRVRSTDNFVDQYAYQTSVGIGGHIFSGILYDQGAQPGIYYATVESSSAASIGLSSQQQQHPNLTAYNAAGGTAANATGTTTSSSHPPGPFYAFNSQFFPHPKS